MTARYALYVAPPPETALAAFGRHWLGYDAETGQAMSQPEVPGIAAATLREQTAAPRFYGFHGTLKPPFALAEGRDPAGFLSALSALAATRTVVQVPGLRLACLGRFLALVPAAPCPDLDRLAADCVRAFDRFRAAPGAAELATRRAKGLTPAQETNLQRWGYPYVFDEFRFHLTLTGPIADEALRDRFTAVLAPLVMPFERETMTVESLCLFRQPDRATPFRLVRRVFFGA